MVERQLRRRDIHDERVLEAMGAVPRERFVPEELRDRAYDDGALPIGHRQTISQPWVVAATCQALDLTGDERVLEIGTGSGYSTAVLARLAREIHSIERIGATLEGLGVDNVEVIVGDGSRGLAEAAPFDAIAVHAASPEAPHSLLAQLADRGRLVVPIATDSADMLTRFERMGDELHQETIGPCRFVPLIGAEGFDVGE
jgi:protein-L-isoaspartate(D-aspartate) O-methyltransferase